jgi:signal transduction histidine kinase
VPNAVTGPVSGLPQIGQRNSAVSLACSGDSLQFTITDDGAGFDTTTAQHGTGLQGMADRLAALGGALHISSQPGHGTTLTGRLPVPGHNGSR